MRDVAINGKTYAMAAAFKIYWTIFEIDGYGRLIISPNLKGTHSSESKAQQVIIDNEYHSGPFFVLPVFNFREDK